MSIHLCTSDISFAGSVDKPFCFPPQIFKRRTIAAVKTVGLKKKSRHNLASKKNVTYLELGWRPGPAAMNVGNITA